MGSMKEFVPTKAWVFIVIIALSASPLFVAHHVPLVDYPFHLARMHILHHQPSDEFLQRLYEVSLLPLPNLAMDALVPLFSKVFHVEFASRLFILLTMVIIVSGVGFLYKTLHGAWSNLNVLFGAILLYNWIFIFGFVNYLFGVGLLLFSIAIWFSLLEHNDYKRMVFGAFLGILLFFSHLVVFVLFAVILSGIGLYQSLGDRCLNLKKILREAVIVLSVTILPATMYFVSSPTSEDIESGFIFADWAHKLEAIFLTPLTFTPVGDAAIGGAVLLLTGFAIWRGKILIPSSMYIILALATFVFILAPVGSKTGWHLDDRIPLIVLLLLVAATKIQLPSTIGSKIVVIVLVLGFLTRLLFTTLDWMEWDNIYEESRHAFSLMETPSVLYVAATPVSAFESRRNLMGHYRFIRPPRRHIGSYAALEPGIFVPMVHATPYFQPIRRTADVSALAKIQGHSPIVIRDPAELSELVQRLLVLTADLPPFIRHAYVYVRDEGRWRADSAIDGVTVKRGSDFMMLQLR
jgi:hypothetical protein